ncbi:MAG: peptidase U34 [Calditrichaeota bacterium]|nr:peptidase U34 [Calditrichota bacterium]
MCDTIVATGQITQDGIALFAKNSDREPNEAQLIQHIPPADHPSGSQVQCTYISIPQVRHTYGAILSRPFWMWGAEMGVNEHGVAIGNEAVFTRMPYQKRGGLTGMDLLRLALERSRNAAEAVEVITSLLETYGQGGNCGYRKKFYYHNSFLIADPRESWVLETAGKEWAAKQVAGLYAISNSLTIDRDWDRASATLLQTALQNKWCSHEKNFSFARHYSDKFYTFFSQSRYRRSCAMQSLQHRRGNIRVQDMFAALRDHGESVSFRPDHHLLRSTVCMHASYGPVRMHQTTASMVAYLHPERPMVFVTGTAAPCTSIFKPLWYDIPMESHFGLPSGQADSHSLFWRHERLHRMILMDFTTRLAIIREERDSLERRFIDRALELNAASLIERKEFTEACFHEANEQELSWLKRIQNTAIKHPPSMLYHMQWKRWNNEANLRL